MAAKDASGKLIQIAPLLNRYYVDGGRALCGLQI